jgi:molybdopterin-guanine dinucleotide biosynthesis protein A
MLHRAIHAVAPLCHEILVSVPFDGDAPTTPEDVATVLVRDQRPDEGPLVGLWTALGEASHPIALVVAGDMPFMNTGALDLLVAALEDPSVSVSGLADGETVRPLPCAMRVAGRDTLQDLVAAGERRLRTLVWEFPLVAVPEEAWRALDPSGGSLRDIDRPEDLD